MKYTLYPAEWRAISYLIREANDWTCQMCGLQCRRPGELYLGWQYELTVAHYDHDYTSSHIFVCCLCVKCHFRHDAPHVWTARRRAERLRGRAHGQLELLPITFI